MPAARATTAGGARRRAGRGAEGGLATSKAVLVLAVVVGCLGMLWPKIFYPMLMFAIRGRQTETDETPFAPPMAPRGPMAARMQHTQNSGKRVPGPHARAGIAPKTVPQGSTFNIIMPIYTLGIIVLFVYMIIKIMSRGDRGKDERVDLDRLAYNSGSTLAEYRRRGASRGALEARASSRGGQINNNFEPTKATRRDPRHAFENNTQRVLEEYGKQRMLVALSAVVGELSQYKGQTTALSQRSAHEHSSGNQDTALHEQDTASVLKLTQDKGVNPESQANCSKPCYITNEDSSEILRQNSKSANQVSKDLKIPEELKKNVGKVLESDSEDQTEANEPHGAEHTDSSVNSQNSCKNPSEYLELQSSEDAQQNTQDGNVVELEPVSDAPSECDSEETVDDVSSDGKDGGSSFKQNVVEDVSKPRTESEGSCDGIMLKEHKESNKGPNLNVSACAVHVDSVDASQSKIMSCSNYSKLQNCNIISYDEYQNLKGTAFKSSTRDEIEHSEAEVNTEKLSSGEDRCDSPPATVGGSLIVATAENKCVYAEHSRYLCDTSPPNAFEGKSLIVQSGTTIRENDVAQCKSHQNSFQSERTDISQPTWSGKPCDPNCASPNRCECTLRANNEVHLDDAREIAAESDIGQSAPPHGIINDICRNRDGLEFLDHATEIEPGAALQCFDHIIYGSQDTNVNERIGSNSTTGSACGCLSAKKSDEKGATDRPNDVLQNCGGSTKAKISTPDFFNEFEANNCVKDFHVASKTLCIMDEPVVSNNFVTRNKPSIAPFFEESSSATHRYTNRGKQDDSTENIKYSCDGLYSCDSVHQEPASFAHVPNVTADRKFVSVIQNSLSRSNHNMTNAKGESASKTLDFQKTISSGSIPDCGFATNIGQNHCGTYEEWTCITPQELFETAPLSSSLNKESKKNFSGLTFYDSKVSESTVRESSSFLDEHLLSKSGPEPATKNIAQNGNRQLIYDGAGDAVAGNGNISKSSTETCRRGVRSRLTTDRHDVDKTIAAGAVSFGSLSSSSASSCSSSEATASVDFSNGSRNSNFGSQSRRGSGYYRRPCINGSSNSLQARGNGARVRPQQHNYNQNRHQHDYNQHQHARNSRQYQQRSQQHHKQQHPHQQQQQQQQEHGERNRPDWTNSNTSTHGHRRAFSDAHQTDNAYDDKNRHKTASLRGIEDTSHDSRRHRNRDFADTPTQRQQQHQQQPSQHSPYHHQQHRTVYRNGQYHEQQHQQQQRLQQRQHQQLARQRSSWFSQSKPPRLLRNVPDFAEDQSVDPPEFDGSHYGAAAAANLRRRNRGVRRAD